MSVHLPVHEQKRISAKDVDQQLLVKAVAAFLKKFGPSVTFEDIHTLVQDKILKLELFNRVTGKLKVPAFNDLVKLGVFNELAPTDIDWFYVRCASVARHLYMRRAGVGALTKVYGGKKRNGVSPSHFCRSSKNILRKCLQALEAVKLVEKNDTRGGRVLSKQGRRDLDRIAGQMVR